MITKSHREGNRKWDREHMATLGCKLRKYQAEQFKEYAKKQGTTTNALLKEYILTTLQQENEKERV
ncbi:MAG: hypothetical protein NC205_03820 [Prevotella sp.]|nr:hypothetical protein [Alistipes senegalensis]MCM1357698.1 hypothetical protein [Prevotella sp.]MCM1473437.1 hypothetical protein [Muribaculaceae bacterium]